MKKKQLSLMIMSILLCLGICINNATKVYEVNAGDNGATAPTVQFDSQYSESYYSDVVGLKGDSLLEKLAEISQDNHQVYTSYDQIRGGNAYSDEDPSDPDYMLDFYTGWQIPNAWDNGVTWNREHVWCQSLSNDLFGTSGAGSDIHHIRPLFTGINSARGNALYTDLENSEENKYYYKEQDTGCYLSSNYFEPRDEAKGDVARILMYMYMHYSTEVSANSNYSKAGNLIITNIVYTSLGTEQAAWDLLLNWNTLDPVDTFESNRNDYCTSVTGLRNPFIDHAEFATMIWDSTYNGDGALNDNNTDVEEYITLPSTTLSLDVGDTYQLNPNTNILNPVYSYSSSNESVASISTTGLVTALNDGTTTISVSCNNKVATLALTVNAVDTGTILEGTSSTYIVATKSSVTSTDALVNSTATYNQTYSTAKQITANNTATLTLSGYDGYVITGFTLSMKSNTSKGAGSLSVTSGSTTLYTIEDSTFEDSNWNGAYTTTYVNITRETTKYTVQTGENIIFLITASTNSLYVESFTIYYASSSSSETEEDKVKSQLSEIETMAQLNFGYYYSGTNSTNSAELKPSVTTSTYMNDTSVNYAEQVGLDSNVFDVTFTKGNPSTYPYIHTDGTFRIYADRNTGNGNTVTIKLKDSTTKISSIVITVTSGDYLVITDSNGNVISASGSSTNEYIINDYMFNIQNTQNEGTSNVNAKITSIDITYGTSTLEYSDFGNVDMRFCAKIPTELVSYVESFGINLSVNGVSKDIAISKYSEETDGYSFAIVVKNIVDYNAEITATAYVMVNGERINLISKTYSVLSIVDTYLSRTTELGLSDTQIGALEAFKAANSIV